MGKSIHQYEAVVIGTSAGGLAALTELLMGLPRQYGIPILVVQHRAKNTDDLFEDVLQHKSLLHIKQADEKERVVPGFVYVAPPDYHLLVEPDRTLGLSVEAPVQFSRPSIDVLFESAALEFRSKLVGILLTGSNNDGAAGISVIHSQGGLTIAQDPSEAQYPYMPKAAIDTGRVHFVWPLKRIAHFLKGGTID